MERYSDEEQKSASSAAAMTFPYPPPAARGELIEITPAVKWLRMPMPYALDHVNIYLVRLDQGWMIIDSGLDSIETRSIWEEIFSEALRGETIVGVYCTHYHLDHMGLAGYLAERRQIPLLATYEEYFSQRGWPSDLAEVPWQYREFFKRAGFPEEQLEQILVMFRFAAKVSPMPPAFTRLKDNCRLPLDGADWRVMVGSGHSPEHAMLFSPEQKILVSGDQLLPKISTNVSVSAVNPDDDPLSDWFSSLDRLEELSDDILALPGHGLPFRGIRARVAELRNHHQSRFAAMLDACADQALSAYELVTATYRNPLSDFDLQLALGECLAHLRYLDDRGHVSGKPDDWGIVRYSTLNRK